MNDPAAFRRAPSCSWLFLLGCGVFACALVLKWMKWPGGSASLVIGAVLALAGAFVHAGRRTERWAVLSMRLCIAMVLLYGAFRLLYWPGSWGVAGVALVLGLLAGAAWWSSGRARKGMFIATMMVLAAGSALMATPVHVLYHILFFETPGAHRFAHAGIGRWYRYGWFLYQAGEREQSRAMLDSAAAELHAHEARTGNPGDTLLLKLRTTQYRIATGTWDRFVELDK